MDPIGSGCNDTATNSFETLAPRYHRRVLTGSPQKTRLSGFATNIAIAEESAPQYRNHLGWLMQLDGDNMRNAFPNAPWVKAVLPIRPGREHAAINWLQRVDVEGADGLDGGYVAPDVELAAIPHNGPVVTLRDAINYLCDVVRDKHDSSMIVGRYPDDEITMTTVSRPRPSTACTSMASTRYRAASDSVPKASDSRSLISGWKCCRPTRSCPSKSPTIRRPVASSSGVQWTEWHASCRAGRHLRNLAC
jgi:hypothetical protein